MVHILSEIDIECPRDTIAEYVANIDNIGEWQSNIKSVSWKSPKPLQLGSRIVLTKRFMGRYLSYMYEILEMIPGHKLQMRTADGPFLVETTYAWREVDDHTTRMILRIKCDNKGFSRSYTPILSLVMGRAGQKCLKRLKALMEE